jgi:nucleoside-diphosphate-sugar epimerase
VQHHACDLLDPAASARLLAKTRPTHLLHLAWFATPGRFWTSVENVRWVEASLGLARAFHEVGGQRFVGAGSCAEYDWTSGTCDERTTRLAPATLYGASKHAVQTVLDKWGVQSGLSVGWGRLFFLYGPHEHPDRLVSSVIRALLAKREAACTLGTQVRDFQHVEDCAGALAALVDSDVRGGVNIASGRAVTIAEVVRAVADQLGASDLVRLGARATSADDPPSITADVQRLRTEVGWTDQLDLTRGLAQTIEWWRHA